MGELMTIRLPEAEAAPATILEMETELRQMRDAMQMMAAMLRTTTEAMEALKQQVRLLEKVTGSQAAAINAGIRERAAGLCRRYRIPGQEKAVAAMIRKDLRMKYGITAVKELPRCDWEGVRSQIGLWDDYKALKTMKERTR